jgi:hypothetical protein
MRKIQIIFIVVILFMASCNRSSKELTKAKTVEKKTVYEEFDFFYKKFHADSNFQVKRVKFPLEGYAMDTAEQSKPWNKSDWIMHRYTVQSVDTSMFKIETSATNNLYYEKIYIEGGGFASERVFKRLNGKWYLVKFIDEDL